MKQSNVAKPSVGKDKRRKKEKKRSEKVKGKR